jgi:hypothetical protein
MNGRLGNNVGFTGQNPALRNEHSVGSPQHRASAGVRLRLEFREDFRRGTSDFGERSRTREPVEGSALPRIRLDPKDRDLGIRRRDSPLTAL